MKAVKKFKEILSRHKRPPAMEAIFGQDTRIVQPPLSMSRSDRPPLYHKSRSIDTHDRRPLEQALATEGVHRDVDLDSYDKSVLDREDSAVTYSPSTPTKRASDYDPTASPTSPTNHKRTLNAHPKDHRPPIHSATAPMPVDHHGKGQAHDPLSDHLYLALGPGGNSAPPSPPAVSESPPAADVDIYEDAYHMELERIREAQGNSTKLFLTRRVEGMEQYKNDEHLVKGRTEGSKPKSGFARFLNEARMKVAKGEMNNETKEGDDDEKATSDAT